MAETIEGGAYLSDDKKTWHDANGKVIKPPKLNRLGKVDTGQVIAEVKPVAPTGSENPDAISIDEIYEMAAKAGLAPADLELGENPTRKEVNRAIGVAKAKANQAKR